MRATAKLLVRSPHGISHIPTELHLTVLMSFHPASPFLVALQDALHAMLWPTLQGEAGPTFWIASLTTFHGTL